MMWCCVAIVWMSHLQLHCITEPTMFSLHVKQRICSKHISHAIKTKCWQKKLWPKQKFGIFHLKTFSSWINTRSFPFKYIIWTLKPLFYPIQRHKNHLKIRFAVRDDSRGTLNKEKKKKPHYWLNREGMLENAMLNHHYYLLDWYLAREKS